MAKNQDTKLEQTKSKVKLQGVITRLSTNDNACTMGKTATNKEYKSLRFMIKTADKDGTVNEVPVELFGMEQDNVYAYSRDKGEGQMFPFGNRNNLPDGYHMFGVRINLGEEGQNLHAYDAVDELFNNLQDGMEVYMNGHIELSKYKGKDEVEREQKRFVIESIGALKNGIDFESEEFVETAVFEQEMVIVDVDVDKKEKKAFVTGRTISYGDKFNDGSFVINFGDDEELKDLAKIFSKLGFGDFLKVHGTVINRAETVETEEEEEPKLDKSNPFAKHAGKEKHKSLNTRTTKNFINELRIEGVDASTFEKKKYKEEDFVVAVKEEKVTTTENPFLDKKEEEGEDLW
ncbi:hypothetical protein [Bacillus thuringiensis]|uniref:hypothetical protein n=1 Tax=Bacillus thuringiensis TaxID=1428 RepID=UPI000BFA550C|nr:hypothetical protein [Bacillus thuringiensis]PFC28547.1 hypothetical protein CN299_19955 [Bacillus thuringiensis]